MGRKSLGKEAKSVVLSVRIDQKTKDYVDSKGGQAWVRMLIDEARIAEQSIEPTRRRKSRKS